VSTSVGFRYLDQAKYVERELDTWLSVRDEAVLSRVSSLSEGAEPTLRDRNGDLRLPDLAAIHKRQR